MKTKRILCPERLRHVPRRFSWIDQRLVRDGYCARCGPHALALYLLLLTVADAEGLSYYSDRTAAGLLAMSQAELHEARRRLVQTGLIAYEAPLYQVLNLPQGGDGGSGGAAPVPLAATSMEGRRSGEPLAVGSILLQMLAAKGGPQA